MPNERKIAASKRYAKAPEEKSPENLRRGDIVIPNKEMPIFYKNGENNKSSFSTNLSKKQSQNNVGARKNILKAKQ